MSPGAGPDPISPQVKDGMAAGFVQLVSGVESARARTEYSSSQVHVPQLEHLAVNFGCHSFLCQFISVCFMYVFCIVLMCI